MFEALDDIGTKGTLTVMLISIMVIFMSGLFFAGTYFLMDTVQTKFLDVDCDIPNNLYVDNCQELFDLSINPFLDLKDILIWFSYFFIFALVIAMLLLGYKSGKNPVMIGVLLLITIVFTYLGIEMSNIYRTLLENPFMYSILQPFTIYNKIMLNFPWFIGFLGLLSMALSIVNYQRTSINTPTSDLNY